MIARQGRVLNALDEEQLLPDTALVTGMGARVLGRIAQSDTYRHHRPTLRCENMYLTILVEQGIVGLVLFLLIIMRALAYQARTVHLIKDELAAQDLRAAGGAILACLILLVVMTRCINSPHSRIFRSLGIEYGSGNALWAGQQASLPNHSIQGQTLRMVRRRAQCPPINVYQATRHRRRRMCLLHVGDPQ